MVFSLKPQNLAIVIWGILFIPTFISNFLGVEGFISTNYKNRIYAVLILILFLSVMKKIPSYFFVMTGIFTVYALIVGNSVINIIADITLLSCPFITYILISGQEKISGQYISQFSWSYYRINLIIFPIFLILRFSHVKIHVYCDILFLFAYQLLYVTLKSTVACKIKFMFILLANLNKSFIVLLAALLFPYFLKLKTLLKGLLASAVLFICIVSFHEELSGLSVSFKRGVELIRQTDFSELFSSATARKLSEDPSYSFRLTDLSSAHRLFELFTVAQTLDENTATFFFGKGLGGGVDMSSTEDVSVLNSHTEGVKDVRVVHMIITYILLKFGWSGIIIFIITSIIVLIKIYKKIYTKKSNLEYVYSIFFMAVYFNAFFTFGNFIKLPMLGICIYVLMHREKTIQER